MNRRQLINRFNSYVKKYTNETPWSGQTQLESFLYWWFNNRFQTHNEHENVLGYLGPELVEAMEYFRTSTEEAIVNLRDAYLKETGEPFFPVLTDVSAGDQRLLTIGYIARMMAEITQKMEDYSEEVERITGYFRAEDRVLDHTLRKFIRSVWREGMWHMIDDSVMDRMTGKFGTTKISTLYTHGRIFLKFARPSLGDNEHYVTFVTGQQDFLGIDAGLHSMKGTLKDGIEMIEEVIAKWPSDGYSREEIFQDTENQDITV